MARDLSKVFCSSKDEAETNAPDVRSPRQDLSVSLSLAYLLGVSMVRNSDEKTRQHIRFTLPAHVGALPSPKSCLDPPASPALLLYSPWQLLSALPLGPWLHECHLSIRRLEHGCFRDAHLACSTSSLRPDVMSYPSHISFTRPRAVLRRGWEWNGMVS